MLPPTNVPEPARAAPPGLGVRTIHASDLTNRPECRSLWFPSPTPTEETRLPAGLPAHGFASPLGYWLVEDDAGGGQESDGLRIIVCPLGHAVAAPGKPANVAGYPGRRFRTQTARLKSAGAGIGEVVVTISSDVAVVVADESTWETLAQPIILTVCQVWRFQAIDAQLDRLTRNVVDDLDYANAPGLASLVQSRRLMDLGWKTRAAIVDLTYFQTPLTDPLAFVESPRSAQAYRALAEKLALEDWSDSIDHRAEVVEATFETITEKLYHLKSHAHHVVLEIIIVVILLIDIAMRLWEASR